MCFEILLSLADNYHSQMAQTIDCTWNWRSSTYDMIPKKSGNFGVYMIS